MKISRILAGLIVILAVILPLAVAEADSEKLPTIGDFEYKAWRTHDPDGEFEAQIYAKRDQLLDVRNRLEAIIEMKMPIPVLESMTEAEIKSFLLLKTEGRYQSATTGQTEKLYSNWTPAYSEEARLKIIKLVEEVNLNGSLSKTEAKLKEALEMQELENSGKGIHVMELLALRNMLKEMESEQTNIQKIYFDNLKAKEKFRESEKNARDGFYIFLFMIGAIALIGIIFLALYVVEKIRNWRKNKKK